MTCRDIGEQLMDLATGAPAELEAEQHVAACAACAGRLKALRQTMAMLDEWEAPEPSPYFDTRLRAHLREQAAARPQGLLAWLRRPVLAAAMAALMTVGLVTFYQARVVESSLAMQVQPGTAVGDLQSLEKNNDLYANFDLLDDLEDMHGVPQTADR